ncbi:MAG TPA: CaiB/BaiF CoA-transferase family protein [Burkholderiaceae bacterium]|nr:CaiB/BaiF CoA-transferase family protein [Burkholderiaceae bacterium]
MHEATPISEPGPLAGLRILDLSRLLPGPAASMHLADYGAEVIKVEDTGAGDYLREFAPQVRNAAGDLINPAFEAINRGKRSICLDLKSEAGRAALLALVAQADAVLESFRPGVMERLGLGWEVLHELNARLVLVSVSGYGSAGPLAPAAGHDINYAALTGVLDQNRAQGVPAIPNLQLGDVLGGSLAALSALLIALLGAQRTGQGRRVEVAMSDGLLMHHFFPHCEVDAGLTPRGGATLLTGGSACYAVYACADGQWLAVGALEIKFWQAFCEALDAPELVQRHWSRGELPGSEAALATREAVAQRLARHPREHWLEVFGAVDACVTPVLTPAEALQHPQFVARGRVQRLGEVTHVGPLAMMSGHTFAPRPAPRAGEHTREVLEAAGCAPALVDAITARG